MCLYCLNTISKIFFKERLKYSSLGNTWTTMQALGSTEGRYTPVGGLRPGFEPGLCIPWLTTSSESTGGIHCYELPNVHTMGLDTQNIGVGKHRRERDLPKPHNDLEAKLGTQATPWVTPTTLCLFNKHYIALTMGHTQF